MEFVLGIECTAAARGRVARIEVNPVNAGLEVIAFELGNTCRVVVDGGWVVRSGGECLSACGSERVLVRQSEPCRPNGGG